MRKTEVLPKTIVFGRTNKPLKFHGAGVNGMPAFGLKSQG